MEPGVGRGPLAVSETTVIDTEIIKIRNNEKQAVREQVVVERALTVCLNNREFVTMVCSPEQEQALVIGFLCSEGIIDGLDELKKISFDSRQGLIRVETKKECIPGESLFFKSYITSGCRQGRTSFYDNKVIGMPPKRDTSLLVTSGDIGYYVNRLEEESRLFRRTGGVHGGALVAEGKLEAFALDVGRHNVLDKLYGQALMSGLDLAEKIIVFSGRLSSEILIKAGKMGCPILIGVSAPTNLGLKLAEKLGITAIGFARENRMNVYTHPERIIVSDQLSF